MKKYTMPDPPDEEDDDNTLGDPSGNPPTE